MFGIFACYSGDEWLADEWKRVLGVFSSYPLVINPQPRLRIEYCQYSTSIYWRELSFRGGRREGITCEQEGDIFWFCPLPSQSGMYLI